MVDRRFDKSPVAFDRKSGFAVLPNLLAQWAEAYPACNLEVELRQAHQWIIADYPRRRKVKWQAFLVNWLSRSQDRGGTKGIAPSRRGRSLKEQAEAIAREVAGGPDDVR